MPRLALGDQLWTVHRAGKSLVIEDGAKKSERKFVSDAAAEAMLEKLVAERIAAGYVAIDEPDVEVQLVEGKTVLRSLDLERAIHADPYDPSAYLVYADWLQSRGDARGELIVQMVNGVDPMPYLKKHKKALYGALITRTVPHYDAPPFRWRYGFIHRVELEREKRYKPVSPTLDAVFSHPSGALVTEVALGSDDIADIRNSLERLVRARPPLRVLEVVSHSEIGDLAPVLQAFRELAALVVKRRSRDGQPRGLAASTIAAIAVHAPPTLRRLELRIGTAGAGFGDLAPLFRRTDLTALAHLAIRDVRFGEQIVDAVLAAPFAQKLETLDLGLTDLDDAMVQRLRAGLPNTTLVTKIDAEPVDEAIAAILANRFNRTWE